MTQSVEIANISGRHASFYDPDRLFVALLQLSNKALRQPHFIIDGGHVVFHFIDCLFPEDHSRQARRTVKLAWFWITPSPPDSPSDDETKSGPTRHHHYDHRQPPNPALPPPPPPRRGRLIMSQPTTAPPSLTPQFCFNTRVLRDFLRISRSQIDDGISTNLNALLTPSSTSPFDPLSTSVRSPPPSSLVRQAIPRSSCAQFVSHVLFPSWQSRSDVLTYCASVATSPDPDDPDLIELEAANKKDADRIVDERLDPYSGRFFPREPRTEQLAAVLRNENAVEAIIRTRTWSVITERCEGVVESKWEDALDKWREQVGGGKKPS